LGLRLFNPIYILERSATLPPDAQKIIFDLVMILKKSHNPEPKESLSSNMDDWSDFISCAEAEPDLSMNYNIDECDRTLSPKSRYNRVIKKLTR
jgi:hypothetical protein